ncbi:MAG: peptidoglycan-binding protein [Bryobacteraceae bacterium]
MADQFSGQPKRGDRNKSVRLAQEWLTYHGFATGVDGDFGAGTEFSVTSFQKKKGLAVTGVVDAPTQEALLAPMDAVQAPIAAGSKTLPEVYLAYARQHLRAHPIEIGGANRGPWVRLYMNGRDGAEWLWCAGFVTWVLRQACQTLGVPMPHPYAFSCDTLAITARSKGLLLPVNKTGEIGQVRPGYMVVFRRAPNDWSHIGVVESIEGEAMITIEGNTDHSGSRNGYEVCRQRRRITGRDYLVIN